MECWRCAETYEGYNEAPPCAVCPASKTNLSVENQKLWDLWEVLSTHGRDSGFGLAPLRLESVLKLLELHQKASPENLEKILRIEHVLLPILQKENETP